MAVLTFCGSYGELLYIALLTAQTGDLHANLINRSVVFEWYLIGLSSGRGNFTPRSHYKWSKMCAHKISNYFSSLFRTISAFQHILRQQLATKWLF